MQVGDKCRYRSIQNAGERGEWKPGIILKITGPFSAKVFQIAGIDQAAGELVTKTSHYIMHYTE